MHYECIILVFSKDRALQLDATLRSYLLHCRDAHSHSFQARVLYTTSSSLHAGQYETLTREYAKYHFIRFLPERDFRSDALALLAPFDSVLFLVDDNIFVRELSMSEVLQNLKTHTNALGFSLRLGRNTQYCYSLNSDQRLPEFEATGKGILKYDWTNAECDFGYPLELSSSVYRTEDILQYLAGLQFQNPNTLEGAMNIHKKFFTKEKPFLLCFDRSVVFSIPLNMVQTMWKNRTGGKSEHSPNSLAALFAQGRRIDVHAYSGFSPQACHQEVELHFAAPAKSAPDETQPFISVIIPCYKQAQYLPEAVESVVNQTYRNWECIIVNDGSPDSTSEVARQLISRYPQCDVRLIEKPNSGLADARNTGIRNAQGEWILPLDSDDMFAPDYMKRAVEIILNNPSVNLVTTNEEAFGATPHEWIPNEYTPQLILRENTFIYASLYKKELWKAAGGYYPGIPWGAEDWNFWIECSKAGIVPKRIPEKLFLYRTHPGTSMRNKMKEHWSEVVAMIHTLHAESYPRETILRDHETIARAHPDTVSRLNAIISGHPGLSMPYFWRGLHHEYFGRMEAARADFEKAHALSISGSWQQQLRLKRSGDQALTSSLPQENPEFPLASVIIPCYNQAHYLPEAVESVASQTYGSWECIIVNDGSPDNTNEVAHALMAKYPGKNIILLEKPNGGLADARNFGIRNARGKYILPLDADDKIYPEMLSKTVAFLESNPDIAIVYTHSVHYDEQTKLSRDIRFFEWDTDRIRIQNLFSYCSLYRREVWETVGGYNTNMVWGYEDWDFWVGSMEKGFTAQQLHEILFFYRIKRSSMITEAVSHDAELKARIIMNHPSLYSDSQRAWASGVLNNAPWALNIVTQPEIIPIFDEQPQTACPPEVMAYINQADLDIARNDLTAAREAIRKALNRAAGHHQLSNMLSTILANLSDPESARQFLNRQNKQ